MAETNLTEKVDKFFGLIGKVKETDEVLENLKKERDALSLEIIETLEGMGLTQIKDPNGRTIFLKSPRIYGSINKENEAAAVKYLKNNLKLGYLFKEQVSSSALGRVISERLEKGLAVPEEYITYFAKRDVGYRTGKPEAE